jgi:large subunit ribosomal protein L3
MSKLVPINKGILAKKIGMTQFFNEDGTKVSVTILEAGPCSVIQKKNIDKEGYNSIQLGFMSKKEKHTNKPLIGHFKKANLEPKKHVKEFRFSKEVHDFLEPGKTITIEQFNTGEQIDVQASSKGMGFAGVMKKHNFRGRPQTHGTHESFRGPGSIGQHTTPGRVVKGKKMPGQMGNVKVNVQNLSIYKIDQEKNLLYVKGIIPGAKGAIITIRDAVKLPSYPYYISNEAN